MLIYTDNLSLYTTSSSSTIINSLKNLNEKQNGPFLTVDHFWPRQTANMERTNGEQMQNRHASDYMNIAFFFSFTP